MAGLLRRKRGLLWRGAGGRKSVLVNHDGIIKIVIFEVVLEGIVLRRRRSLRLGQLLSLGKLNGIIFEFLQHRVVQVVESVIGKVIHGRSLLRPIPDMTMPLNPCQSMVGQCARAQNESLPVCVRLQGRVAEMRFRFRICAFRPSSRDQNPGRAFGVPGPRCVGQMLDM
jgi:hypothetical protein